MSNETNHLKLNKPKLEDHIGLTIPALAENFEKIDEESKLIDEQLAHTVTEIGDKSTLPEWLRKSLREVVKQHDDYLRQFGVNVRLPPYNAGGGGDDYDKIIQALEDMDYKGILYMPGEFNISKPIHLGKQTSDVSNGAFLVQNLRVAGNPTTRINKTTNELDVSGKNSIFYTNAVRLHFSNIHVNGLGFESGCIGFNLRSFHTFSSIRNARGTNLDTGFYLDSVYIAEIIECHISTSKQVFDSSAAEKTSLTIDKIWGENIWRFGYFRNINYSKFGTLLCDWVNVPAPQNLYQIPVTMPNYPTAIFDFLLCATVTIDVLANEHGRALSFIRYGSSSLNVSFLHVLQLRNNSGTTIDTSTYTPVIALHPAHGVRETIVNTIHLNSTDCDLMAWFPYASNTYGSKFVPFLTIHNMPIVPRTVRPLDNNASNTAIMVKHPLSVPIYWDKTIPDPTAKPYRIKVNSSGQLSTEAVPYFYFA